MTRPSAREMTEYESYLLHCSDRQVQGCYDKEKQSGNREYMTLARLEAAKRGFTLDE